MGATSYEELVPVPRSAISLPLELPAPSGFVAEDASTFLPDLRELRVVRHAGETAYRQGDRLAPAPELPDLTPSVSELFEQLAKT